MSAIAGILSYNEQPLPSDTIRSMMRALQKYPADDVQIWQDDPIALGCHAQWVTAESIHERLPFYDSFHQLAITADVILDNREELCNRLQVNRSRRMQITDAEIIVLAYRKWGKESPNYLIGDFAFVIWDKMKRQLFGARDLLGNRTLYYHHHQRQFAFCTVINPLFTLPGIQKKINESWLSEFLAIPIILDTVDVYSTVYSGIELLPPAHSFTVVDGKVRIEQYGSLAASNRNQLKLQSNGEYEEAFREVFQTAVTSKLRTYRQVGASLSGGLDSGTVVSFAANPLREQGKTLHALSYVPAHDFVDWTSKRLIPNERPYIQAVVDHVGNIQENYLDFTGRNSFDDVDDLLDLLEAPYKFIENSFWIKGVLEQAQRHDIGILLNGARGNYTISWGPAYDHYAHLLKRLRWIRFYRELKHFGQKQRIGRKHLFPYIAKLAFPFAAQSSFGKRQQDIPLLVHPDLAKKYNVFDKLRHYDVGLHAMDDLTARDHQFRYLAVSNHQGVSTTKLSLRYKVLERDPTSDPRVVRFCLSVPVEQYVQNGEDRSLIRRATAGYLPDKVRLNHRLYGIQGADWVHRVLPSWGRIKDELNALSRDSAISQFINIKQVKESLAAVGNAPRPEQAYDPNVKILMQSVIVYRFLKQNL